MSAHTEAPTVNEPTIGTPSSVWRVRRDAWDFLRYAAKQLASDTSGPQNSKLQSEVRRLLRVLEAIEMYWAMPGLAFVERLREKAEAGDYRDVLELSTTASCSLPGTQKEGEADQQAGRLRRDGHGLTRDGRPKFEVLVIDDTTGQDQENFKEEMRNRRRAGDDFLYELNVVPSFEDAIVAILLNPDIQACIIRPGFKSTTSRRLGRDLLKFLDSFIDGVPDEAQPVRRILTLAERLADLRPELDLYLMAGVSIERVAGALTQRFSRIFRKDDTLELHLSLLAGIAARHDTPFFTAVQHHSRKPTGVFHALPISRGSSVVNSKWIQDMGEFYGLNLLLAETSATSGGLDSLLDPHGSIKEAQTLAARAFGSKKTFFVTNGTSTANKIVHQSIVAPGDVVLVDRNCHKSHHYALVLAGARVAYLEAYPLDKHSFYGAVPLENIKKMLLDYRSAGRLDEVKMIALTNCTFDGIVYDAERVMAECLAIKPDLVFLWDEAWFAFAGFHPIYRRRTAMAAARKLENDFNDPAYAQRHASQARVLHDPVTRQPVGDEQWLKTRLLPDPARTRLRVYATQSTHKTLTALRQGSMIHVFDQDYGNLNEEAFREAYMTHTSTSPNYQILASLDIGRRQAELEGYELVQKQTDLAVSVSQAIAQHPLLRKYFRILSGTDLIPEAYRQSRVPSPLREGLAAMEEAWRLDEFVVDPSRFTLDIGRTGVDGDTFKHKYLMNEFGIQVNKTSRNTVLFMTNIGTSRSAVAYLIEVLVKLARTFEESTTEMSTRARKSWEGQVEALTMQPPPLPDFSHFADRYRTTPSTPDGDIRTAYFDTYKQDGTAYRTPAQLRQQIAAGKEVVSASFVTPYPPGFPVLVPGQVITQGILDYMTALDTREIHGYNPDFGFRVMAEPEADQHGA
ncbi:ornithine decarboxylase [Arthrobacter globiformis]|uniref:aminotransferase class I/II-fold pyridoxal phosphate-dependent enzyme n=1 Tax=Arthrobacter globiformis TaxID=1665 RepID=UPI00397D6088